MVILSVIIILVVLTWYFRSSKIIMDVVIKKKRIKRIYLRVSPKNGSVNISAPIGMPDRIIKDFVEKNINWIKERQAKILLDKKETCEIYFEMKCCY